MSRFVDVSKPKTLLRIDELYAFIAQDADGEGLPAFQSRGLMLPMVCADKARVDSLREVARKIARETGNKITLCRFSLREEIEVIEP
jgi:dihydroorotase-like cyclic amidohydrolase